MKYRITNKLLKELEKERIKRNGKMFNLNPKNLEKFGIYDY